METRMAVDAHNGDADSKWDPGGSVDQRLQYHFDGGSGSESALK